MVDFEVGAPSSPSSHHEPASAAQPFGFRAFPQASRPSAASRDGAGEHADLGRVWRELCAGQKRFGDVFFTEDRCFAELEDVAHAEAARPIEGRRLEILVRVLLGEAQKAVAIDLGLAPSTVAGVVGGCLRSIGCACRSSSPPVLLIMAAHAAHGSGVVPGVRVSPWAPVGREGWVVSAPRPELLVSKRLSNAEQSILRLLVEGDSLDEIASRRRTSRRTIANQLAALFRKFGVSGRAALLEALVRLAARWSENSRLDSPGSFQ